METVIGLLIVVLPLVFKLIGRRMEQAADEQKTFGQKDEPVVDWAEVLREHLEQPLETYVETEPVIRPHEPVTHDPVKESIEYSHAEVLRPEKKASILIEEEEKPREKIDVKKMIVYSEIMKPKYNG